MSATTDEKHDLVLQLSQVLNETDVVLTHADVAEIVLNFSATVLKHCNIPLETINEFYEGHRKVIVGDSCGDH